MVAGLGQQEAVQRFLELLHQRLERLDAAALRRDCELSVLGPPLGPLGLLVRMA